MKKYVYVLWRGDEWLSRRSMEQVAICTTKRRCCELARKDGATREQVAELLRYGQDQIGDDDGNKYTIEVVEINEAA